MVKIASKTTGKNKGRAGVKKGAAAARPRAGFHAATLARLCKRAGVESVSPACYVHLNAATAEFLRRVLRDAVTNVDARNAVIISEADARRALARNGITYYGAPRSQLVKYAK